jgi:hypothetical protein
MSDKVYYSCHIDVKRVTRRGTTVKEYDPTTRSNVDRTSLGEREVDQVANLSFTAATTEGLSDKVAAHMALITDGEEEE